MRIIKNFADLKEGDRFYGIDTNLKICIYTIFGMNNDKSTLLFDCYVDFNSETTLQFPRFTSFDNYYDSYTDERYFIFKHDLEDYVENMTEIYRKRCKNAEKEVKKLVKQNWLL